MDLKDFYKADDHRYDNEGFYVRCGRSGVMLPKVSLGFWHNFGGVDSYERSRAITHYAFDHGIPTDSRMAREKFLTSDRLTPEYLNYISDLKAEAEAQGKTIAQAALAWVLQQEGVTSVLVGASSVAQLEMNLKSVAL